MSFLGFLKRRQQDAPVPQARSRVPDGERVYAIGDIHGRDDLFAQLLATIESDNAARGPAKTTLIMLGDLVDRGPESAAVIERAMHIGAPFDDVRLLIGNHEECFLAALTGEIKRVRYFMRIGGDATVRSYWSNDVNLTEASFDEVAAILPGLIPAEHVQFLGGGEVVIEIGDYAFVHAGIRPGVPLEKQSSSDLRWIRGDFLDDKRDHGAMIVHGHTIRETVDEWPNRIGIDTGAYSSGKLTAIGLEGAERWYLTTGP
jgi:serine/threonine protein phosphatase 1